MGRRKIKVRGRAQGPSRFFVIALAVGLIAFATFFILMLRNPPKPVRNASPTSMNTAPAALASGATSAGA